MTDRPVRRLLDHASGALVALFLFPAPAEAAICGPGKDIKERLAGVFREQIVAAGIVNGQYLMEVYVSAAGTWTLLMTGTGGRTCILAAGDGWQAVKPDLRPDAGQGDPT